MKIFTCSQPQTLRDFTDANFPQGSFCFAQLLRAKDIKVNGVRTNKNVGLRAGDEIIYYTSEKQESAPTHFKVFEDENIYIADKLSGVSCEGLSAELNTYGTFYPVHRLDRNTCGLLVYAKTPSSEQILLKAFKEREVKKTYIAVCKNCFKSDARTLTAYLKKDQKNALVRVYDDPAEGRQKIITEYRVAKRADDIALVTINLHTGRTHQIRAHMAHVGCPVLGDNKYGDEALNKKYGLIRQCLVAKRLEFVCLSGELSYLNGFAAESSQNLSKIIY